MELIHSLFAVRVEEHHGSSELWYIKGGILTDGLQILVHITALGFAQNTSFFKGSNEEFESHVTGVNSVLQRDLDAVKFQESSEEDDGIRERRNLHAV